MKLLLIVCLLFSVTVAYAQNTEQEILRLQKGEFYYHYLTGDFPNAMNHLKLLRSKKSSATDEADAMEATMLLSLGLHEQAQEIFSEIQQKGRKISSQTWFFLARRWFELGEYESTLDSIKNIDSSQLALDAVAEAQFMKAASLIEFGEHKKALVMIGNMPRSNIWTGFARHNLILSMFKGNNSGQSTALLIEDATFYLPETKEGRDLRDRIHLISALHFLDVGKHRSAEKHLKRMSLAGPYTPVALLQYGWANVEQGQYEAALQPWRELQIRFNQFNPEVMESMLGVPHVLELMYASTQALKVYEETEKRLLSMKSILIQMNKGLAENSWLEDWIYNQNDQSWGWQTNIDTTLPLNDTAAVLQQLVTDTQLVNQMTEYRDLLLLTNYLSEKENSLKLWLTLVDKREQAFKVLNASATLEQSNVRLKVVKDHLEKMNNQLKQSNYDLFALPNENEVQKISLLTRTAKEIETLALINKASRNVDVYQQRWDRVKGVFLWQMNANKADKQWGLRKELGAMERLISISDRQLLEARLAYQWSPSSWIGMKNKITSVLAEVGTLKTSAEQAKAESKEALLVRSTQYLDTQIHRINDYLSQSRLSIARLYDDALQRQITFGELSEEEQQ